jgi:MFS family permease
MADWHCCISPVKGRRVYQIEGSGQVLRQRGNDPDNKRPRFRLTKPQVGPTVLLLGMTSMLTDISAEMVSTILPLYLVLNLGLSPLAFGVIDGLYLGGAAIVRLISGFLADRTRQHKEIAVAGYTLSAISRLGLLLVGGAWTLLVSVIMLDRLGKGIRTAPRDAMISLTSQPENLATSFGVHRALDTAGAMIGPFIAFGILTLSSDSYDVIFIVSLCFAVLGVGVIGLFVQNPSSTRADASVTTSPPSLRAALSLAKETRFGALLLIGAALSLMTMSDGFLYLTLQNRLDLNIGFFPLLYVATALIFMLLAIPMGQIADRFGRGRVFIGGYVVLIGVYILLLIPWFGVAQAFVFLFLLGVYYAATDGVLMAMGSMLLPQDLRTSGLALLSTVTNLGRLAASILFGFVWTWQGMSTAVWVFFAGLLAATLLSALLLVSPRLGMNIHGQ